MPSPFPGMDPYLENPALWSDVHHELISGIRAALAEQLRPRYFVRVEERIYLSGPNDPGRSILDTDLYLSRRTRRLSRTPASRRTDLLEIVEPIVAVTMVEEEVHESYLKVIDAFDRTVVSVIEVLSPSNKVAGAEGLESFQEKRNQVTHSPVHWVEIDLLRTGVSLTLAEEIPDHEYLVHVSPVERRPKGLLWPIRLSQRLPVVRIPLRSKDGDTPLDLQSVLETAYDRAGYDLEIDYTKEPVPPLSREWKQWADRLLREKGLRPRKARK